MGGTVIGAGHSLDVRTPTAFHEAACLAAEQLDGRRADLTIVFASREHLGQIDMALPEIEQVLAPGHLLGCCANGVTTTGQEIENGPAVAVWAASLPGAGIESFELTTTREPDQIVINGLPSARSTDFMLLISDPIGFPAAALLDLLADDLPGMPIVGGIASGVQSMEEQSLIFGNEMCGHGAVGVRLRDVDVRPCVAQGASPVGPELVVTAAEGNRVLELAFTPALEKLAEVLDDLDQRERQLALNGLLLGVVIDENRPDHDAGNFLVRGILGADDENQALLVGDHLRVGQMIRFHVRDAASAEHDLSGALDFQNYALNGQEAAGALLFTCNGRGSNMFELPNHDACAVSDAFGSAPTSGFFSNGEIGPVAGRNFLHGFTATLALFAQ